MIRTLIIAALILGIVPHDAQAKTLCGKRADMVDQAKEKYGETRRGGGLVGSQAVIELYVSDETGTWTIFQTTPNGVTCLMAAGELWQIDTGELTPTGDPV